MNGPQVLTSAQTVVDIAAHFEELKRRALSAPGTKEIIGRGYLNPTEETALRQLQVSYWQSRNALLEIVESTAPAETAAAGEHAAEFLVAFAAAATLVDAAMFLRDRFHRAAPIRAKLDEPDPVFDVPPQMYETVQHSLTCPQHAWRLLQARGAYLRGRRELRRRFTAPPLGELTQLVDRKITRLRPSPWTYLRTRAHVWGSLFTSWLRYDLFGQGLFQVQKYASSLMADRYVRAGHEPRLPPEIRQAVIARLQSGDVFIVRKEHAVTNYFLPGYWPHAALHLGRRDDLRRLGVDSHPEVQRRLPQFDDPDRSDGLRVLEALKDGVRIRPVDSPLASDSVVVLRPQLGAAELAEAFARALSHEGKPYDFDFDFTCSHRMVCTEVIYRAYDGLGPMRFELTRQAGRMALAAEGLIQMALIGRGFDPLLVYSPADATELLTGASAVTVLRRRTPAAG